MRRRHLIWGLRIEIITAAFFAASLQIACGNSTSVQANDKSRRETNTPQKTTASGSNPNTNQQVDSPTGGKQFSIAKATAVAFVEIHHDSTTNHCMGFVLENGKILTALHCFQGIPPTEFARRVKIRWTSFSEDSSSLDVGRQSVAAQRAEKSTDQSSSAPDVALVTLASAEPLPIRRATISANKFQKFGRVLVPGPDLSTVGTSAPKIDLPVGYLNIPEPDLSYNPNVKEGFSGAPLLQPENASDESIARLLMNNQLVVFGMHLGLKNGSGYGLTAEFLQNFVTGQKSEFK